MCLGVSVSSIQTTGGRAMTGTDSLADLAGADIIDSRDLIEAVENIDPTDEQEVALAAEVAELADAGIEDWQYGAQMVRDSYFEEFAQQLAEDIGAIPDDASWPTYCID